MTGGPNFFIVGAAKSGTTSLYAYLRKHPDVFMSPIKEPHFFADLAPKPEHRHIIRVVSDEQEYLRLFRRSGRAKAVGEASPSYLCSESAPTRIHQAIPDARIVILLRDPVERAHSHYLMDCREGQQDLDFFEAIQSDYERSGKGWGVSHLYVELGLYYDAVRTYLNLFGSEKVGIWLFEDMKRDTSHVVADILEFLGLPRESVASLDLSYTANAYAVPRTEWGRRVLRSTLARKVGVKAVPSPVRSAFRRKVLLRESRKPPVDPRAGDFLQALYAPDIAALERLLQRDLSSLRKSWN